MVPGATPTIAALVPPLTRTSYCAIFTSDPRLAAVAATKVPAEFVPVTRALVNPVSLTEEAVNVVAATGSGVVLP